MKAHFDYVLSFGKYRYKTIADVLMKDSNYIMWLIDNNILKQGVTDEVFESAYIISLEEKTENNLI